MTETTHRIRLLRRAKTVARDRRAIVFGQLLKRRREAKGLSQYEMARGAPMDCTYPSLLERGLRMPTLHTLHLLSEVLEWPLPRMMSEYLQELKDFKLSAVRF